MTVRGARDRCGGATSAAAVATSAAVVAIFISDRILPESMHLAVREPSQRCRTRSQQPAIRPPFLQGAYQRILPYVDASVVSTLASACAPAWASVSRRIGGATCKACIARLHPRAQRTFQAARAPWVARIGHHRCTALHCSGTGEEQRANAWRRTPQQRCRATRSG